MIRPRHTAGAIRAGSLGAGLRPHVIGLAENLGGPSWLAVLLTSGVAAFSGEDDDVRGPALVWRPWNKDARAVFRAGAEGTHVILGPTALASAVGHMPVSQSLHDLSRRTVIAPLDRNSDRYRTLVMAFASVAGELGSRDPAARAVVEAYLRIILIEVHRIEQGRTETGDRVSPAHGVFADFCALVEAHFRERWTVNDYARALGLSRDRLGDICRRIRGFGPKEVIDRRVALEARLQLEGSSSSVEQIAALLGFASAAQFNRFFSRIVGRPPGAYRAALLNGGTGESVDTRRTFEWP